MVTYIPMLLRAAVLAAVLFIGYQYKAVTTERDQLLQTVATQQETLRLTKKVEATTATVMSARVVSSSSIKKKAKDVQVEILKRIPDTPAACQLSGDWRLLHDSAATADALPVAPSGTDAEAVTAQEAALTVTGNYEICNDNADRLDKLQQWIEGVSHEQN